MPPVSVTSQARNLLAVLALEVAAADGVVPPDAPVLPVEVPPHAAATSAKAAVAPIMTVDLRPRRPAVVPTVPFTRSATSSPFGAGPRNGDTANAK
jgi:hypothetical protein